MMYGDHGKKKMSYISILYIMSCNIVSHFPLISPFTHKKEEKKKKEKTKKKANET